MYKYETTWCHLGVNQDEGIPFFIEGAAKNWLYYLLAGSITTWTDMKRKFLKKYLPIFRAARLRKENCGIK